MKKTSYRVEDIKNYYALKMLFILKKCAEVKRMKVKVLGLLKNMFLSKVVP